MTPDELSLGNGMTPPVRLTTIRPHFRGVAPSMRRGKWRAKRGNPMGNQRLFIMACLKRSSRGSALSGVGGSAVLCGENEV